MQLQLPQKNKEGSKNPIAHISSSRSAHVYVRLCLCDFAGGSIFLWSWILGFWVPRLRADSIWCTSIRPGVLGSVKAVNGTSKTAILRSVNLPGSPNPPSLRLESTTFNIPYLFLLLKLGVSGEWVTHGLAIYLGQLILRCYKWFIGFRFYILVQPVVICNVL